MNWFKSKNPEFELSNYGKLRLHKDRNGYSWFGRVNLSIADTPIELTIEVGSADKPSAAQINRITDFENNWESLKEKLFERMADCFRDSKLKKDKNELKKMYFLSAIDLKKDGSESWIVMEPEFDVVSFFNFLPRFTIKNSEICWSNLK
jgi:hypothetical protein